MQTKIIGLIAGAALFLGGSAANAGALTSATWTTNANTAGVVASVVVPVSVTGSSTSSTSWTANVSLASTLIYISTVVPTANGLAVGVLLKLNPSTATINSAGGITQIGAITGNATVSLGGLPGINLFVLNQSVGVLGSSPFPPNALMVTGTAFAYAWQTGPFVAAGLSMSPVLIGLGGGTGGTTNPGTNPGGIGTRTFVGTNSLTAGGGGSITLIAPTKTNVNTVAVSKTATFTSLKLTFAVPEPGTLVLMGAGLAGLLAIGRRRA